jgi:lipopolysaccharide biosynthesis glycosyltransferase
MITLYVGYDPREAAAYHVFCESVIEHASEPVQFIPLHKSMLGGFDGQRDGTNAFIFSRFLVPYLNGYNGAAIFCDGDMVCRGDIAELWRLFDPWKAVQVVKHEYVTKAPRKYLGSPLENSNLDYPRKNWSSVMLWNCGSYCNRRLNPETVAKMEPKALHRFEWLEDNRIGELPQEWNWLDTEYGYNADAKLIHYTLGVPGFSNYVSCDHADDWHNALLNALNISGEVPVKIVARAHDNA